jgi:(heptosyl)LPS beta-1,4-glucosyltransferase
VSPAPPNVPVTVVIAARDAAAHVGACVASVSWAAERLVIEGGSSDDTRLIALAEGATVFTHPFTTIGRQRNLAVETARHEWVLVLDAEERCTPELADAVRTLIAAAPFGGPVVVDDVPCEAFRVPRWSALGARRLRGGRWRPDAPVRLFRRRLRFDEAPGADRLVTDDAPIGTVTASLVRQVDLAHDAVAERMTRAAREWALQRLARGVRPSPALLPWRAAAQFLSSYVWHLGFLDGSTGIALAFADATEIALRWTQLWALARRADERVDATGASGGRGPREMPRPRAPR